MQEQQCFNQKVYALIKKIPPKKVTTYKEIALKLNSNAYQAVGNACNNNKDLDKIPCYKVIKTDGSIGGYVKGYKEKKRRLKKDGIKIFNNKINLKKYLHVF